MKKKLLIALLFLIGIFTIYQVYKFTLEEQDNINPIYLIPENAVFIIDTQKPIDTWDEISNSDLWKHLQTNSYINDLSKSINELDTVFQLEKKIFQLIGERQVIISAHVHKSKDYELFYVIDLEKFSKINLLKKHISKLVGKNYKVTKRTYKEHEIIELYNTANRKTLYLTFIKNQLIASFTHILIENSIDQYNNPVIGRDLNFVEINEEVETDGFFKLYIQHKYLDNYLACFIDSPISKSILEFNDATHYTGFNVVLKESALILADGSTNVNQISSNYLKVLQKSGKGKRTIDKVAPLTTAMYLNFSFENFTDFKNNFDVLAKEKPKEFENYQKQLINLEETLDINLKDHFYSWIGDEIGLLHLNTLNTKKENAVLVIKANDILEANKNIKYILTKIKEETPLKFKQLTYKDYKIHFLDLKGFFKLFAGDMFKKIEKPYVTIIDNYVLFSNTPNSLKEIITSYQLKQTLNKSQDFSDFNLQFYKESNLFAYVNTAYTFDNLKNFTTKSVQKTLQNNKKFVVCFPQIGYQLSTDKNLFKSYLGVLYEDYSIVQQKMIDNIAKIKESIQDTTLVTNKFTETNFYKIPEIFPKDLSAKTYQEFYDNKKLKFKVELKNGLKHGDYKEYYNNGALKISGNYKKDKQVGTWKGFDKEGKQLFKKRL